VNLQRVRRLFFASFQLLKSEKSQAANSKRQRKERQMPVRTSKVILVLRRFYVILVIERPRVEHSVRVRSSYSIVAKEHEGVRRPVLI
jgi:hypothetical protein